LTYLAILLLGFSQTLELSAKFFSWKNIQLFIQVATIFSVAAALCTFVEYFLYHSIASMSPDVWGSDLALNQRFFICISAYGIFVTGAFLSLKMVEPKSVFMKKCYLFFWCEGYVSQRTNRWFSFSQLQSNQMNRKWVPLPRRMDKHFFQDTKHHCYEKHN
jgi:hypothetical protein